MNSWFKKKTTTQNAHHASITSWGSMEYSQTILVDNVRLMSSWQFNSVISVSS